MLPFLKSVIICKNGYGRCPVIRTIRKNNGSLTSALIVCDLVTVSCPDGKEKNFWNYEIESFEWFVVNKRDHVFDLDGKRYEVVEDLREEVHCFFDGGHYVLPKTHLMRDGREADNPITSVTPRTDMASRLSQRLNNDYLTAKKEKQILDKVKRIKFLIDSLEEERDALRAKEEEIQAHIEFLQSTFDNIEFQFECPHPKEMEALLALNIECDFQKE